MNTPIPGILETACVCLVIKRIFVKHGRSLKKRISANTRIVCISVWVYASHVIENKEEAEELKRLGIVLIRTDLLGLRVCVKPAISRIIKKELGMTGTRKTRNVQRNFVVFGERTTESVGMLLAAPPLEDVIEEILKKSTND